MSDNVERLRDAYETLADIGGATEREACRDGADEIERLRAERDEYERQAIEAAQKWMAERALADELGQALEKWLGDDLRLGHATSLALAKWKEARRDRPTG